MKKIAVVGASGRTGRYVVEALREHETCALRVGIVSPQSSKLGSTIEGTTARYSSDLHDLEGSDAVVDFSTPDVSVAAARYCASIGVPIVVATTGHTSAQFECVRDCAQRTAVGIAPNTSIGAAVMISLFEQAKRLLGSSFDIEIMEIHHRLKKDSPSGTARSLTAAVEHNSRVVCNRQGLRQSGEIGVASLRGGDVVGDHTVYFLGNGERIELTHRVSTRAVFGEGAVRLAEALMEKPVGLYSVKDLIANS